MHLVSSPLACFTNSNTAHTAMRRPIIASSHTCHLSCIGYTRYVVNCSSIMARECKVALPSDEARDVAHAALRCTAYRFCMVSAILAWCSSDAQVFDTPVNIAYAQTVDTITNICRMVSGEGPIHASVMALIISCSYTTIQKNV